MKVFGSVLADLKACRLRGKDLSERILADCLLTIADLFPDHVVGESTTLFADRDGCAVVFDKLRSLIER